MKKAVIYWSGTGNTAAMASAIAAGMGEGTELFCFFRIIFVIF